MRTKNRCYLKENANELRNNSTPEEIKLWKYFLKDLPITVNRQKRILNYIVDFYISSADTAIEIDGIQHSRTLNSRIDNIRDRRLTSLGITVLRYTNHEINNEFGHVCNDILYHITPKIQQKKGTP